MRIFVDCDDTLVLYVSTSQENAFGYYFSTPWNPNVRLIEGLKRHAEEHPQDTIVIWSGGGMQYAHMWMERLGLADIATALGKDKDTFDLIQEGDVVIDDMALPSRTHGPMEWPEVEV